MPTHSEFKVIIRNGQKYYARRNTFFPSKKLAEGARWWIEVRGRKVIIRPIKTSKGTKYQVYQNVRP